MTLSATASLATPHATVPIFPAINGFFAPCSSISKINVVVVVLPFVPVIPINGASLTKYASSISVITGRPRRIASAIIGLLYGIPGFFTTNSKPSSNKSSGWRPQITVMPFVNNACASGLASKGLASFTVTNAPSSCKTSAAATPLFANPKTNTFLCCNAVYSIIYNASVNTASNAKIKPVDQNTRTTFHSDHPDNSK